MNTSKIIIGTIGGGKYTVTAPIMQEHYGIILKIEGAELPEIYQVDFSNDEHHGTSVTMIGNADGVLIPRQFIDTGKDVFAFLYWVGEDYGKTVYKFRIPNQYRPDRTNEQPTPEEQSVIDQAISALNSAVEQTAQDKADADASAQSASADADRAEQAKNDASTFAQRSANSAQASADYSESAQASATASAQSASQSAQIKNDVESMVDDAQGYANEAKGYATQASNYADDAQGHANTAHGYATSASESAGTATSKASEASGYAHTASQKATEAGGYADTSSQKASESAQSAEMALGYKNDALQAKTDAETAQASAESARDEAQTAQELAETAESNAESTVHGVLDSLDLETTSGSIVETHDAFPVSPEKMVVDINPVQNLNGYDHPWPAGGGKNLLGSKESKTFNIPSASSSFTFEKDSSQVTFTTSGLSTTLGYRFNGIDLKCTLSAGTYYFSSNISNQVAGSGLFVFNADTSEILVRARLEGGGWFTLSEATTIRLGASLSADTVSGTYWFQLEEGSIATAYAPYSNICPISGWTEVDVEQSGVNVWDEEWEVGGISSANGANTNVVNVIRTKGFTRIKPLTSYYNYFGNTSSGVNFQVRFYDADKNYIGYVSASGTGIGKNVAFVTPSNAHYLRFQVQADYGTTYNHDISINYPSTDHDYHSYTGRSITINLGQTVYGGHLDVVTGELTIDMAMVDLGTLNYGYDSAHKWFVVRKSDAKSPKTDGVNANIISDTYTVYPRNTLANDLTIDNAIGLTASSFLVARNLNYTNASDFKTAMNGHQLVYELAEPIEYQLTPQQITLFKNYNALWADTGDISEFAYREGEFATKANIPNVPVEDVQVNGTSVVQNKIANIDLSGIEQNAEDIASLEEDIFKPYATDTAIGAIASFVDGADDIPLKSFVVDINPVQDLHGQDAPYPAGGGKNLLKNNLTSQTRNGITVSVDSQGIITLTGTATVQTQFDINTDIGIGAGNYILSGISGGSSTTLKLEAKADGSWGVNLFNGERSLSVTTGIEQLVIIVYNGASLSNVQIKPMIRLASVTDVTYAPYSNICPISGWTQVDVEQRGKNLFDISRFAEVYPSNCTYDESADELTVSAQTRLYITGVAVDIPLNATNGGYLQFEAENVSGANFRIRIAYEDGSSIETSGTGTTTGYVKIARAIPAKRIVAVRFNWSTSGSFKVKNFCMSPSQNDTPYEHYTGRSITIDLGQTVYGAKLYPLEGKAVVDRAMVDLGTLDWYMYNVTQGTLFRNKITLNNADIPYNSTNFICSNYRTAKAGNRTNGTITCSVKNVVDIIDNRYSDETAFKTAMSGVQLCYKLATPIEIQLSANQINSLYGVNNIWADSGDTEVEYRADTKLYIEKLTQPEEDDMVADSAISEGQFFMVGNTLYRALANIASGATITVGTNAQRVSLADALNIVNA